MTWPGPGIVFMGTPEFAVESLKAIIGAGYPVKGVVTSPDKPSGRGLQQKPSPVKEFALANKLPVLQPLKLKDPEFLKALKDWQADLQVIVAFRMLPEEVWSMPRLGTFNLHASLLPQYRGAAPINWAIIHGETQTGVTTFFLNHEIDTGSVIDQEKVDIAPEDTAGDLHDRLMETGARLVVKTIRRIAAGEVVPVDQHVIERTEPLRPAPKIFKDDCKINWHQNAESLYNFIRGLSPYPAAWTELATNRGDVLKVKIYFARPVEPSTQNKPGSVTTDGRTFLHVAAGKGSIAIERIQLEGKRQIGIAEFLNGFPAARSHFL